MKQEQELVVITRHLEIERCLHLVMVWFFIRKMRLGGERYLNRGLRLWDRLERMLGDVLASEMLSA